MWVFILLFLLVTSMQLYTANGMFTLHCGKYGLCAAAVTSRHTTFFHLPWRQSARISQTRAIIAVRMLPVVMFNTEQWILSVVGNYYLCNVYINCRRKLFINITKRYFCQLLYLKSVLSLSVNGGMRASGCTVRIIFRPVLKFQNVNINIVMSVCPFTGLTVGGF
jgi:hypothetical protein